MTTRRGPLRSPVTSFAYCVFPVEAGATSQFSAVPLNLAAPGATADHIVTGSWSKKAAEEAGKYARVHIAAKGDNKSLPAIEAQALTPGAAYVHYCDNETIQVAM